MIGQKPVCLECKHFNRTEADGLTCTAFPKGIPDVILIGGNKHDKPLPNQGNKIIFERIEKDKQIG
jgi:hypothetical protein